METFLPYQHLHGKGEFESILLQVAINVNFSSIHPNKCLRMLMKNFEKAEINNAHCFLSSQK